MRPPAIGCMLAIACAAPPPAAKSPPAPAPVPAAPRPAVADSAPTVLTPAQDERDRAIAAKVAPILDAFTNSAPQLLRDGRVVYVSNRDGLPALYVADTRQPTTPPRKLPTPDERVGAVRVLPDERSILFTSDVKSDGNFRIFRVDLDGGGPPTDLTPGE